jgi:hypothetical protein
MEEKRPADDIAELADNEEAARQQTTYDTLQDHSRDGGPAIRQER